MKKFISILTAFVILFFVLSFSYTSSSIDMNLFTENTLNIDSTEINEDESVENDNLFQAIVQEENSNDLVEDDFVLESAPQEPTTAIASNSSTENFFTPSNIVNIILIAVGVVLIFLAIAILIKIK